MNVYSNQYQNNQVMTASPEQILIMLYDGAIRFVRQAKFAIEDNRAGDKAIAISKAVAIITEFSNTLDYEVGGEIALNLGRLYDFMIRELSAVNARSEIERLLPVENILLDLREGFSGAAQINQHGTQLGVKAESAVGQVAVSF
ncbi:MAG: flagellar export chaperone FliS [Candidatus Zixiibacteriota bacterium]|nr:MAG: flagellar export chaperone FliS [candidate division Zixibacteria bacterium]